MSEAFEKWLSAKPRYYTTSQVALMRNAWQSALDEAAKVADIADKNTHPADIADMVRGLK